jgi:hypothetical protein
LAHRQNRAIVRSHGTVPEGSALGEEKRGDERRGSVSPVEECTSTLCIWMRTGRTVREPPRTAPSPKW